MAAILSQGLIVLSKQRGREKPQGYIYNASAQPTVEALKQSHNASAIWCEIRMVHTCAQTITEIIYRNRLTHWGRVTHICVGKLTIIGSDNGLAPGRRQAIIRTNAGISLIGPWGTNFSEILIEILTFSFKKMRLKVSSGKRRPFCLGLNELSWCKTVICIGF